MRRFSSILSLKHHIYIYLQYVIFQLSKCPKV